MNKFKHLVDELKPSRYDLSIDIDEANLKFSGQVLIKATAQKNLAALSVHAHELEITKASVNNNLAEITYNQDLQVIELSGQNLQKNDKVDIFIEYKGKINDSMVGIYPSRFSLNGVEDMLIGTQLESHHARELFPCVDEPAAKAVFNLSLTTRANIQVLSNTPSASSSTKNNRMTTTFEDTPVMSTYLLAFVAGNMLHKSAITNKGVEVRVWSTPDKIGDTELALTSAVKSLELLEDFFDIPYPLQKCDLVAMPDFSAGAMENWGLCTFRETALLFNDKTSSLTSKKWVVAVVAHELAHQWFGNLVTMQWWTDLWLNEGFARWMETYIPDKLYPEWSLWEEFITGDYTAAQNLDMLDSSHPVELEIDDPENIRSIFDAISYDKGASIILMLYRFMGEKDFKAGLRNYMKRFAYANAKTKDLWACMEEASGLKIEGFMHSWTSQMGFPVLNAERQGDKLVLSQNKYSLKNSDNEEIWPIPLSSTNGNLLEKPSDTFNYNELKLPLNANQGGFYVTKHSEDLLSEAYSNNFEKLPATEKIGLIHDLFLLNKNGGESIEVFFAQLGKYSGEEASAIWDEIAGDLMALRSMYDNLDSLKNRIDRYIQDLIVLQYERLGWEPKQTDSDNDKALRPIILALACNSGLEDAISTAKAVFKNTKAVEELDPDSRGAVLSTISRYGDADTNYQLHQLLKNNTSPHIRSSLINAITATKSPEAQQNNLDLILSKEVRLQDTVYWLAGSFRNSYSREKAWYWLRQNWDAIRSAYGTDVMMAAQLPSILGAFLNSEEHLSEFDSFFENANTKYIDQKTLQAREKIAHRVTWAKRNYPALDKLLDNLD